MFQPNAVSVVIFYKVPGRNNATSKVYSMSATRTVFSIVVLTYNREKYLTNLIDELVKLPDSEIIIVDNNSDSDYSERLSEKYEEVHLIQLNKNYGAVGRNFGIEKSKGEYIITLDDDVWGVGVSDLLAIRKEFERDSDLAAICFKVIDEKDGTVINWSHPNDKEKFSDISFETYEISEGAVVLRKAVLSKVGLYPEEFFISHEGPDLAFRILDAGYRVIYSPLVQVIHAHAVEGRASWRRYYYDTRNSIWLAYKYYNRRMLIKKLPLQLVSMFVYSLRDGFFKYYLSAVKDGLNGIRKYNLVRSPVKPETYQKIKEINRHRPSFWFYIKHRLFKKSVRI